ncbi:MAG: fibro-slime domain-containing protein [Fibromonadaceae bacterium]|nr:fibro-slime domain-containing protein [Fibromonadaceae bacterium]
MNSIKKIALTLSVLLALLAGDAFAQCSGKTVYIKLPSSWGSSSYIMWEGQFKSITGVKEGEWTKFTLPTGLSNDNATKREIVFSDQNIYNNQTVNINTITKLVYSNSKDLVSSPDGTKFLCSDFGPDGTWIMEDPTTPGKTVTSTQPPNARYFYFFPPKEDEWVLGVPYLKIGSAAAVAMEVDPDRCGWYKVVYFNRPAPSGDARILLGTKGTDKLGIKGVDEDPMDWGPDGPTPFDLKNLFDARLGEDVPGSLYFVAQKGEIEGWTTFDPNVEDPGRCAYKFAAKIYFKGTTGNSFSRWESGAKHAEGICRGYVQETLGADGKMKWKGQPSDCRKDDGRSHYQWDSETDFVNAFKSTPGQNVELCYDMPFQRLKSSGLWEFDAFYMCPDGEVMDYEADRQGTKGCVGHGGPGARGGFYLPNTVTRIEQNGQTSKVPLSSLPGTTYSGNRVAVKDTTKWCYDRGWFGYGQGDLTGKNTAAEINAEMQRVCTRPFRQGEIEDNNDPIEFEWLPEQKDVKGLLCFESAPAEFIYQPGQEFFFRGDDDIWVFINNQLVLDLGGNHMPAPGYIKLDTISKPTRLVEGEKYALNIFFCDRRAPGSNVRITTNMYFSQQSGIILKGDAKGSGGADVCIQQDGGSGNCAAVASGSTGPQTLCGDKTDLSSTIAFYIRNRSGSVVYDLNSTTCTATGVPGELRCYGGVTVNTKTGNAKINNELVNGLTGTWYLYVKVIDPRITGVEDDRVGIIQGKSSIRMAWGDIWVSEPTESKILDRCKNPATALTGEWVPICISDGNQTTATRFDVNGLANEVGGQSFKLTSTNNHNGNRLWASYDSLGTSPVDLNSTTFTIPGGNGGAPKPNSGSVPGVLVLWVTGDYDQQIDSDNYYINVSGRAADERVTLTSLVPQLQWTKALGGAALAAGANKGSVWNIDNDPESGVKMIEGSPAAIWVGQSIKLHLRAQRDGKTCTTCNYPLSLTAKATGSPTAPTQIDGQLITSQGLNIVNGEATLDIAGRRTVQDPNFADITVQGVSGVSKINWTELQFEEPPVPVPESVQIFDMDGDGVGDRVVIAYNQGFKRDSLPNVIEVKWDTSHVVLYGKGVWDETKKAYLAVKDTAANRAYWAPYFKNPISTSDWKNVRDTIVLDKGPAGEPSVRFSKDVLTRSEKGTISYWISFTTNKGEVTISPTPAIEDKIPAVVVSAMYLAGDLEGCGASSLNPCRDRVSLVFSEPVKISVASPSDDELRNPFAYKLIEGNDNPAWDILRGSAIPTANSVRYGISQLRPSEKGDSTALFTFDRYNDGTGNKSGTPMPGDSVKFAALGKGYDGFGRTILADLNGNAPNPEEDGRKLEGRKPFTPEKLPIGEIDPNYPNYYTDKIKETLKDNSNGNPNDYANLFNKDRPIELLPVPPECKIDCIKEKYPGTIGMVFNPDILNELSGLDVPDKDITIYPRAFFHTNLGLYVADNIFPNGIKCNDAIFPIGDKGEPSCKDNRSQFYIAWDMKDTKGRFVGSGAYVGIYDFRWEFTTPATGLQRRDEIEKKVEMHGVKRTKLKQ